MKITKVGIDTQGNLFARISTEVSVEQVLKEAGISPEFMPPYSYYVAVIPIYNHSESEAEELSSLLKNISDAEKRLKFKIQARIDRACNTIQKEGLFIESEEEVYDN